MPSRTHQRRLPRHEPTERSTYRKIMTILGRSNVSRRRLRSLEELVEVVQRAKPPSFTYFRATRRGDSEIVPCSSKLILARIRLCADLGLISRETGQLTNTGSAVLRRRGRNEILARQVRKLLATAGFDPDVLRNGRGRSDGPWFPTAKELYDASVVEASMVAFRLLLNLLVDCGVLETIQSRIYFPGDANW